MIIGAITAFFMGLLGIIQNDIKRVVAYSTLSQLGYMTVALGASAYAAGIFHLMTHAFFKALLFLAAGSVIVAMHHEQDIRKMGGLKKYMPITYWTFLIGTLALIGFPGFSGFFSKDSIIEAVHASTIPGAGFAYLLVLAGVFITAFYSFRLFFIVFHGKPRFDAHTAEHLHESPPVITVPLILLAVPSVGIGAMTIGPLLFGDFFEGVIYVAPEHDVLAAMGEGFHGAMGFVLHGVMGPAFWLAMAGLFAAWYIYMQRPQIAAAAKERFAWLYRILDRKYGFDDFNEIVFANGSRKLGTFLWKVTDLKIIDGFLVNGTAKLVAASAARLRHLQTGYLYHYAFSIIIGLAVILTLALI